MPGPDAHLAKWALEGPDDTCGDTGVIRIGPQDCFVALVDVLGHGAQAHQVALMAEQFLADNCGRDLIDLTQGLHDHLRGTRGAVAALCRLVYAESRLSYVGVGNINTRIYGSGDYRFVPRDGILGYRISSPRQQSIGFHVGDTLVLSSDGVREHFEMSEYPGLLTGSAHAVAEGMINRLGKGTDDASCIVLRY